MNYLNFFGFSDEPFRMTPDRAFYFPSANHTALIETIRFGLRQGDGFILVTGEVGTGKTLMLRLLMSDLDDCYETALLVSPHLTPKQLLLAIFDDMGQSERVDEKSGFDRLIRTLNGYLYELSQQGKKLLIIVDEAQNLPNESIEQLRLLSNFETDKQKLLQILLVGQPELDEKIQRPELRQLLQRVNIMETLHPLSHGEMVLYAHYRLNKAGRGDIRLDKKSRKLLWSYTRGFPRLINKLMSRALLVAYAGQQNIDHHCLREAASSLRMRSISTKSFFRRPALVASLCGALIAIGTAVYLWIGPNPDFIFPWL